MTDPTNTAHTMLSNIDTLDWDKELLQLLGIPEAVLPVLVPASGVIGATGKALLRAAIPIAVIAGDQQAAAVGGACHPPCMARNTYGTGCFMLLHTGTRPMLSAHRLLSPMR